MQKTERRKDNKTISLILQVSKLVGKEVSKKINFPFTLWDTSSNRRTSESGETVCRRLKVAKPDEGKNMNIPSLQPSPYGRGGFTLAEVLITLGVIGIVAAITLPSFIGNYQAKVRTEQNRMVQYKLTQATDLMKSHGKIGNYATTKDFVNELKKYFKIAQICENDNLEQCWPTKVIATDGTEVNVSDIKDGKSLNPDGWTKETIGLITADGTPMIVTYKDDCPALEAERTYTWQTEDNKPVTNATTGCIAAIYDLNGKNRPNKSGQDVRLFNSITLGSAGMQCTEVSDIGLCLSDFITIIPLEYGTSEYDEFMTANGLEPCSPGYKDFCKPDYWAGANKVCIEGKATLPTDQQLILLTNYLYNANCNPTSSSCGTNKNKDKDKAAAIGMTKDMVLWTNQVIDATYGAYYRIFFNSGGGRNFGYRSDGTVRARCIVN